MKKNNSKKSDEKKKLYLNEFDIFKFLIENSSEKNRFLPIKNALQSSCFVRRFLSFKGTSKNRFKYIGIIG